MVCTLTPSNRGTSDPSVRGPIIPSRLLSSFKSRNAIGAHSGSYSIYRALAIAMGALIPTHKSDYPKTEPPVEIPPQPSWYDPSKIVSFDLWGHLTPQVFMHESDGKEEGGLGLDVRPSTAVTDAHIKMSEIGDSARKGEIPVDGKTVLKSELLRNPDGCENTEEDPGVVIRVSKAAVEPIWWLPGVADRFGMKNDATVGSGIPILKRYGLPAHLIPKDSRVEIDAKIAAGYFTSGKQLAEADLIKTVGRTWEETEH